MLATDLNALLRVPSRIVLNPTDLTIPFPYGGTSLGLVRDIVAEPGQDQDDLIEENLGVTVAASVDLGQAWGLTAVVRALEEGQAPTFFTTETGASSGEQGVVHNPMSNPPGAPIATLKVLVAPLDELQQFFNYFPAAIAKPKVAAKIANRIGVQAGLVVAFMATPRTSDGLAVRWKKKEDLAL